MTQTTETSRLLTLEQAAWRTAELIAACPVWCVQEHSDLSVHPDDVTHRRIAGRTVWGDVEICTYPEHLDGTPDAVIYVPEHSSGGDLTAQQAVELAAVLVKAAALYAEVTA